MGEDTAAAETGDMNTLIKHCHVAGRSRETASSSKDLHCGRTRSVKQLDGFKRIAQKLAV